MMMTMYPYAGMLARWALTTLTLFAGVALAQGDSPVACSGDEIVDSVNWDLTDNGEGLAYALGGGGVYISCDDGATWTKQPSPNASGYTIFIHPLDPAMIFVGTFNRGVYRSVDYGVSFAAASAGIMDDGVMSFVARPDGTLLAGTSNGIYESDSMGTSWSLLTSVTAGYAVRTLAVDPYNSNNVYAGTNGGGAFRSYDGGNNWQSFGLFTQVNVLSFSPVNPSYMVATAWDGIWHSADGGTTWQKTSGIRNSDFAYDPNNATITYRTSRLDGAHKSADGGWNWTPINTGLQDVFNDMYSVHVLPSGTLLIGTEFGGVYRSVDGGASWSSTGSTSNTNTSGDSGTSGGTPLSQAANLSVAIIFRGDNGNTDAGKDSRFKVTITNNGPGTSTETTVRFNWSHDVFLSSPHHLPYSMTTTQGFCTPSYSEPDCTMADIPSGGNVVIEFEGSTEKGERHTFNLDVEADNLQSAGSAFATRAVKSKVETTTTCFLIVCTTTNSGGGAADGWLLLLLAGGVLRSRRSVLPRSC
jgi:hypothetical protein